MQSHARSLTVLLTVVLLGACSRNATTSDGAGFNDLPSGQLPDTITPTHYTLALTIDPTKERFAGTVAIRIDVVHETDTIWLHGESLAVAEATLQRGETRVAATWSQLTEDGVARLKLGEPVKPGSAVLHIRYSAPFDTALKGLYKVMSGGHAYAFTQFEAISARLAFPSFDEPRFKTPFDVTVTTGPGNLALGNTPAVQTTKLDNGNTRTVFATSKPMPTYLVAWAVGPLDVVEAPPIPPNDVRREPLPFRGVTAKGLGKQLAYALAHTPAMVSNLERYFGTPYPYAKLDIVAVPDFGSGAMENVGLVTFREWLLLVDEHTAAEDQKKAFAYVMAHELAHQWFGNLVTMPWWDDIWLNESFATWMGNKVVADLYPEYNVSRGSMKWTQGAMRFDSLTSARKIRQPILSNHDIRNAFDPITYEKGGAVLEMFEHWLGEARFRDAIRAHLDRHAWGTATADDLMGSLDRATGRPVSEPFRTFLDQPGLPKLTSSMTCNGKTPMLSLTQSRYLPVGSKGDQAQSWRVPVCVKQASGSACTVLSSDNTTLALPECGWYMPNEHGAAYARISMAKEDWTRLRNDGFEHLTPREKIAVTDSVVASFDDGSLTATEAMAWFDKFAKSPVRQVATAPMGTLRFILNHAADPETEPRARTAAKAMYRPRYRELGWRARRTDSSDQRLFRASVIKFLALDVEDDEVRRKAAGLGRAYAGYGRGGRIDADAVEPQLADVALQVAVEEGDEQFFDHVLGLLVGNEDATSRNRILKALGHAKDPALSRRALDLVLDTRLRSNELGRILTPQFSAKQTKAAAWAWLKQNFDALVERVGARHAGQTPWRAAGFCSAEAAEDVRAFFAPRVSKLAGGPRDLAGALESIELCEARVKAQQTSVREAF